MLAADQSELCAAGEKTGRTAFVDGDVGLGVAVDCAVGWRQGRERQGIGRCARGQRERTQLRAEELAEHFVQPPGPGVLAVGHLVAAVGRRDRFQDLGADRSGVVAEEALGVAQSTLHRNDHAPKARNTSVVTAR